MPVHGTTWTMAKKHNGRNGASKAGKRTYSDGQPFDRIHYLQAKLLLKPDRFAAVDRFREFGRLAERAAAKVDVDVLEDIDTSHPPRVREIVFVDTPDFRLYSNGFILRRRVSYVDGFPAGDPEIVFKYRYPDLEKAAAIDVRPNISGKFRVKFKSQALPLDDHIGGYRTLFSHNCEFGVSQVHERDRTAMTTIARVFPALAALRTSNGERVSLVNEGIVEELLLPLGKLDFGKGVVAKSNVALWRARGDHVPIIGEYSFQVKFDRREDVPEKSEKLVKQFFITLQHEVKDWIALGTTKTGLVYRLKGRTLERRE
jgi:hypothetical protein